MGRAGRVFPCRGCSVETPGKSRLSRARHRGKLKIPIGRGTVAVLPMARAQVDRSGLLSARATAQPGERIRECLIPSLLHDQPHGIEDRTLAAMKL